MNEYPCSQSSLYAALRIMWGNYDKNLAGMTAFKLRYTALYGTEALEEIDNAQALPDDQARGADSEAARISLVETYGPDALWRWQMLKAYIEDAYGNLSKPYLEAAGWGYYSLGSNRNWEKLGEMMAAGAAFLADEDKVAVLTANENMPPEFVAVFGASKTAFDTEYDLFMGRRSNQPVGTVNKIEANNEIYKKGIQLSKDAQLAFKNAPKVAATMNFSNILRLVDGQVTGGGYDEVHTVDAGSNKVVQDIVLVEGMIFKIDVQTEGGTVTVCRNVATGCEVSGVAVAYGAPVDIPLGDLVGMDNQLVMTNLSATPLQVRVRWRIES